MRFFRRPAKPCMVLVVGVALLGFCQPMLAHASFAREFERYQRRESTKVLDALEREIETRILDEKAEREKLEGGEPGQIDPSKIGYYSMAQDGGWVVRPAARVSAARHSNYFNDRNDAAGETVISYIPSVSAVKTFDAWRYRSDYELYFHEQKNYEHNNRFEHSWSQSVARKGSKLEVRVRNDLDFIAFPSEEETVEISDARANSFGVDATYTLGPKTSVTGYYANQRVGFKRTVEKASGLADDTFGIRLTRRLRPRISGYLDYSYRFSRPPKRPESDDINAQDFLVGLQGALTPKLFLDVGGGIQSKEYTASDDKLGAVFRGVLRYEYSPKTSFSLYLQRQTVPVATESSTDPLNQTVGLSATYAYRRGIRFFADQSVRFIHGAVAAAVTDPEHPEIYTTKVPESVVLTSSLGTRIYPGRGLALDLAYGFDREVSELQVADYTNHTVSAEVTQQF